MVKKVAAVTYVHEHYMKVLGPLCVPLSSLHALAEKWDRGRTGCSLKTNSLRAGGWRNLGALPNLESRGLAGGYGGRFGHSKCSALNTRRGACDAWGLARRVCLKPRSIVSGRVPSTLSRGSPPFGDNCPETDGWPVVTRWEFDGEREYG